MTAGGPLRIDVVGAGRLGSALVPALRAAGHEVPEPRGRGATGAGADAVLLAVPDAAIAEAAARIAPGPVVGHLSGMTSLAPVASHAGFSLHPLLPVTGRAGERIPGTTPVFAGAWAAVAGVDADALALAERLARDLGMVPFRVADPDRPAYHAAASIAANFLLALEDLAERLAASAGVPRQALFPLVDAAVGDWQRLGAQAALTGPVARGDERTVAAQRAAVAERLPGETELFDALVAATRRLALPDGPPPTGTGSGDAAGRVG